MPDQHLRHEDSIHQEWMGRHNQHLHSGGSGQRRAARLVIFPGVAHRRDEALRAARDKLRRARQLLEQILDEPPLQEAEPGGAAAARRMCPKTERSGILTQPFRQQVGPLLLSARHRADEPLPSPVWHSSQRKERQDKALQRERSLARGDVSGQRAD